MFGARMDALNATNASLRKQLEERERDLAESNSSRDRMAKMLQEYQSRAAQGESAVRSSEEALRGKLVDSERQIARLREQLLISNDSLKAAHFRAVEDRADVVMTPIAPSTPVVTSL